MHPATDGYPLALLPIANKPLLAYQLEFLERNGIHKIIVVIEKKYMSKIEAFFNKFYKQNENTQIEIVAISDEEESANVLIMLKDKINVNNSGFELMIDYYREIS